METQLPPEVLARQREQQQEDNLGKKAAGAPLPGPLGATFSKHQSITVGNYQVRPWQDADFDTYHDLGNPVEEMVSLAFDGEGGKVEIDKIVRKISRGRHAWEICLVQTTPVEEVDKIVEEGGPTALKVMAKKKFGNRHTTAEISRIVMAAMDQMNKSWDTMLSFGPEGEKNGEAASSNLPP